MRPWHSTFELTFAGQSSQQVLTAARKHSRHIFWPGLGVWITRDGELRARIKEWGRSETPTLTARLIDEAGATRIVGRLSWTNLQMWQLTYAIVAGILLVSGLGALFEGHPGLAIIAGGFVFLALLLVDLKSETGTRALEERVLRERLLSALGTDVAADAADFVEER